MAAVAAQATSRTRPWRSRATGILTSLATAFAILGLTMLPFFTPAWIHFEQDRAGASTLTGYSSTDVHQATDSIVHDLILGGGFDARVGSAPVLDPAERSHMRDVRGVFGGFAVVVVISITGLLVLARRAASPIDRRGTWAAVRHGASWLAVLLVVLGVLAVAAFDAAFELFHEILFPGGNFNFDPRTEKLVQLFPEQFWSETALVYGAVAIAVAVVVAWYAGRRAGPRPDAHPAGATGAAT